jgi:hypothetical protein
MNSEVIAASSVPTLKTAVNRIGDHFADLFRAAHLAVLRVQWLRTRTR